MNSQTITNTLRKTVCGICLALALCATGCQMSVGGQTLPSPYYFMDDIQYFPAGPEMKLSREAAAMQRAKADQELYR
jgi:hypothetical protein